MAKFQTKSVPKPPSSDTAVDLAALAETITAPEPVPVVTKEPGKRGKGRPPSQETRTVFGTRLKAETIADVEALKAGLRLKMQGEAIERAVAFYRAHIITKTRRELSLEPQVADEAVLLKAFKVDD
ncbi:hypothetical protein G3T14_20260 [Methylobacterium sp. BTF04]|uniref:hypothetical protein n=1 Tax=Methylobacterium sp. BTF04 TaxID=2708300 RepID=UPI0013D71DEB|nr:hypothetical protein [Methylobacterium sp. BTF04]